MSLALAPMHVYSDDADCLLSLAGDIDIASTQQLTPDALNTVTRSCASRVTIDLSLVTFMDAAGLGLLVAIRNEAMRRGNSVTLLGVSRELARLLNVGGLAAAFGLTTQTARC